MRVHPGNGEGVVAILVMVKLSLNDMVTPCQLIATIVSRIPLTGLRRARQSRDTAQHVHGKLGRGKHTGDPAILPWGRSLVRHGDLAGGRARG
jgi:hypothetical protein